jgi:hypothetical protein
MLAPIENLGTYPSSRLLGIHERGLIERSEPFCIESISRAVSGPEASRRTAGAIDGRQIHAQLMSLILRDRSPAIWFS